MYLRTVLRSISTRAAMAEILSPCRCNSKIVMTSPSSTTDPSPCDEPRGQYGRCSVRRHRFATLRGVARNKLGKITSTKRGSFYPMVTDAQSGLVHTVGVTPANVADVSALPHLLREEDRAVFGDKGYVSNALKRAARRAGVFWGVSLKARPKEPLSKAHKRINRRMSSIRARVEHVFRVMKCQFGYRKVRYTGIAKNAVQVFSLIGLANLYLARRKLLAA